MRGGGILQEVTGDGVKTWKELLAEFLPTLKNFVNNNVGNACRLAIDVSNGTILVLSQYIPESNGEVTFRFCETHITYNAARVLTCTVFITDRSGLSGCSYMEYITNVSDGSKNAFNTYTNNVVGNGVKIRLLYG